MKQIILLVIAVIVGAGAGAAIGITIINSKSKAAIADMQAKMQQSEESSQSRIRSYSSTVNRLNNELDRAKIEIESLKQAAAAAEEPMIVTAENEIAVDTPIEGSVPENTRQYIVKSGDSLWIIAKNQLGSGSRFEEILKLNPKISAESNLVIGSKLIIPAK